MSSIVEKRVSLQRLYTRYSGVIDKILRFIGSFIVFTLINEKIGFMQIISSPLIALVISLMCAFLPTAITVILLAAYTIVQLYALAPGIAAVTAILFLIMFVFCFRFQKKQMIILLLMPIAFVLKIPMLVPIAYGLLGTPASVLAVSCGVIFYYVISYVESYTAVLENAAELGVMEQLTTYTKQFFGNKEMWFVILSFALCLIVVYNIKKSSGDYSWKIAVIVGATLNMTVLLLVSIVANITVSVVWTIVGAVLSAAIAMLIEFFAFPVDYSRTEYLQFEDDEYYYYVKAVPKAIVAAPKKTVKTINERQETRSIQQDIQDEISLDEKFSEDLELQKILQKELNK